MLGKRSKPTVVNASGVIDFDYKAINDQKRRKEIKKKGSFVGITFLIAGIVLADYALPDGTIVRYSGGTTGNEIVVTRPDGTVTKTEGVRNDSGRVVPPDLVNSDYTKTLPSQSVGSNNNNGAGVNSGKTVPIFQNGQWTGSYGNVYTNTNGDGYTQTENGYIRDQYGAGANYDYTNGGYRVDITTPTGSGGTSANTSPDTGTTSPPADPPPPPPPPRYAVDSFELYHNSAWEQARLRNGREKSKFYAGEPVEVRITGENISTATVTFEFGDPNQDLPVMLLDNTADRRPSFTETFSMTGSSSRKNGESWEKTWAYVPDGTYRVTLNVRYTNGRTNTRTTQIEIKDSIMDNIVGGGLDIY